MKTLKWVKVGNDYIAQVQPGKAIISPSELPPKKGWPYIVRLETKSGDVVSQESFDLYGCKAWASVNLPLLDGVTGPLDDCGNVHETLEICQRLLSQEIDAIHWLRIEYIRK